MDLPRQNTQQPIDVGGLATLALWPRVWTLYEMREPLSAAKASSAGADGSKL